MTDRIRVGTGLRNDCVDVKPIDFDFSEGYAERWEPHPSCRTVECEHCDGEGEVDCDDCDGTGTVENDCPDCDGTGEVDGEECVDCNGTGTVEEECGTCDGTGRVECSHCDGEGRIEDEDGEAGFPMMNYLYPLGGRDVPDDCGKLLDHLPLTVVLVDDTPYLALTGGGMDLSWEICAAYVALGYYPPAHFCGLPRMAGRGQSEGDKRLLAICREALHMRILWASNALRSFDNDFPQAEEVEARTMPEDEVRTIQAALQEGGEAVVSGFTIRPDHGQGYKVNGPAIDDQWFYSLDDVIATIANRR